MSRRLRVLVAKPGLDGHDRGAHVVAYGLRDAGMEVIYTGIRQTAAMIAHAAVEEDVDCVGLSIMSGSHVEHSRDVIEALAERDASDIAVVVGGIVPADDLATMRSLGVAAIFGPGTPITAIADEIRRLAR
jgi:methylmalonyl-CoA mutase, C-terminal domain